MEVIVGLIVEEKGQDHPGAFVGEGEEEEVEDPEEGREILIGEVVVTRRELAFFMPRYPFVQTLCVPPFCDSSVKAVDKREGAGAHNWGTMKDDIETYDLLVTSSDSSQFKCLSKITHSILVTMSLKSVNGISTILLANSAQCTYL